MGRVVLIADEQEPAVEEAVLVDAVGVVEAAPQDLDAAVVLVRGQTDVRVRGDDGLACGILLGEVRCVEFRLPGQRRARDLVPPEHLVLVADPIGVPVLDLHLDLAHDLIGAVARPGRSLGDPHEPLVVRVLEDVAGAVLEAHEVAGRGLAASRRGPAEADHRPPRRGGARGLPDPGECADGVIGHLRVVGARLHGQVATGERGLEAPGGQAQLAQQGRSARCESECVGEESGAEADGHRQGGGVEVESLAGVAADGIHALRFDLADRLSLHELRDRGRPEGEEHLQVLCRDAGEVERHEDAVALHGRADAGLFCGSVERVGRGQVDDVAGVLVSRGTTQREARGAAAGRTGEQPARRGR